jgi:heme/copper-type cytochrome/quinol oxidase subunit 2
VTEKERVDQQQFDDAVNKNGKVILQALAGVGILAAILMSMVALVQSGDKQATSVAAKQPAAQPIHASATKAVAVASVAAAKPIETKIVGGSKRGPDGKDHDVFTKTEFAVKVGQPVTLKIDNTDDVPHSITAPTAGVNIVAQPGVHSYTLVVNKAGKFEWNCMLPCDTDAGGWAMQHPGYMSGYITAA